VIVYCSGRFSEPHIPIEVPLRASLVYQCGECNYDVSVAGITIEVEREVKGRDIDLHSLAQIVTRVRSR
jgi:hypothetical protein